MFSRFLSHRFFKISRFSVPAGWQVWSAWCSGTSLRANISYFLCFTHEAANRNGYKNVSLYFTFHRPIQNVAEPILLTVLKRQPRQQVGVSPSCQPWQRKLRKLRKSGNDYAQSQLRACKPKTVEKVFYSGTLTVSTKSSLVETVVPNRTRPRILLRVF